MSASGLRVLIGFLLAPGLPALLLYLVGSSFVANWEAAFGPKILAIVAYVTALVIGIPMYVLMERKAIDGFAAYLGIGALVGLSCYLLLFGGWAILSWQSTPEHARLLLTNSAMSGLISVLYATVASAVFWLIVKWRAIH